MCLSRHCLTFFSCSSVRKFWPGNGGGELGLACLPPFFFFGLPVAVVGAGVAGWVEVGGRIGRLGAVDEAGTLGAGARGGWVGAIVSGTAGVSRSNNLSEIDAYWTYQSVLALRSDPRASAWFQSSPLRSLRLWQQMGMLEAAGRHSERERSGKVS